MWAKYKINLESDVCKIILDLCIETYSRKLILQINLIIRNIYSGKVDI